MIDVTEAAVRGLAAHFKKDFPTTVPGVSKPSDLVDGRIIEGWSNQQDTLIFPAIEIDAPVSGERVGRTATVINQARVKPDGTPTADPAEPNFLWTIHFGDIEIPIQVRVNAGSKIERAAIDVALEVALIGDFDNDSPLAVSDPVAEYYNEVFQFRQAGATRYVDSTTTAGRNEFTSLREVEAVGSQVLQYIASSFTDLSVATKAIRMDGDFALVPSDSVTIFDPTT